MALPSFNQQKELENRISGVNQWSSMVTPEINLSSCLVFYQEHPVLSFLNINEDQEFFHWREFIVEM